MIFKALTILFALLLLCCGKEPPKLEKLDCDYSCDDEKIKAWYQKKFGELITDSELSITSVYFDIGWNRYQDHIRKRGSNTISIAKTAAGIHAKYFEGAENIHNTHYLGVEFSMEEWLDLVRILSKFRVNEWEKKYGERIPGNANVWELEVSYSDREEPDIFRGYDTFPENWKEFKIAIAGIEKRIKEKAMIKKKEIETKLSVEYQKKFGMPISDIELSTNKIDVDFWKVKNPNYHDRILVTRKDTDTNAIYWSWNSSGLFEAELDMEEWLDLVNAIYKCRVDEWEEIYRNDKARNGWEWNLAIFHFDKDTILEGKYNISRGISAYPPNWDEFKKAMSDMDKRVRKKAEVK